MLLSCCSLAVAKDLEACVWLEAYLQSYKKCLILISHSQDFLNGVCTHIIWLTQKKLTYYTGAHRNAATARRFTTALFL